VYTFDSNIQGWIEYFKVNPPEWGATDLFCAGRLDRILAAAGFAASIAGASMPEGEPRVVIIFPADSLESQSEADFAGQFFSTAIEYIREDVASSGKKIDRQGADKFLRSRISLKIVSNNQSTDLLNFLNSLPQLTAVFIVGAELYLPDFETLAKIDSLKRAANEGQPTNLEEDVWVRTVHHLASQVATLSSRQQIFTLLFVQRFGPVSARNSELLLSIENCAVATVEAPSIESNEEHLILKNADRWLALAREQKIDEVIKEIDALPFSPINQALVKAQCLMAAHRPILSFGFIEPFVEQIKEGRPMVLFNAARIAKSAGQYSMAVSLVRAGMKEHLSEPELNIALKLAASLSENKTEAWAAEKLTRLYPQSPATLRYKFTQARDEGEFADLSKQIAALSGAVRGSEELHFIFLLASAFGNAEKPDYERLIASVESVLPSRKYETVLACASHALRTGNFQEGVNVCVHVQGPSEFHEDAAWRMVDALKYLVLRKQRLSDSSNPSATKNRIDEIENLFTQCLNFALTYLSSSPTNGSLRAALYRVLSADTAGLEGIIYLTHAILNAPPARVTDADTKPADSADNEPLPLDEYDALLTEILTKIPKPIIVGVGSLPSIKDNAVLTRFFNSVVITIEQVSIKTLDDEDIQSLLVLLHIAILLSRELLRDYEANLIAMTAAGMSASGHYQPARNLGEIALQLSSEASDENRRAAWLCYSDIYLRAHNPQEALLGLGCALRCSEAVVSPTQRYQELVLTCRILRELRLVPFALEVLSSARELAVKTNAPTEAILRLDYMELALRFRSLVQSDHVSSDNNSELQKLAYDLADLNRRNREQGNEILPTTLLLAQVTGQLKRHGQAPDGESWKELQTSFELLDSNQSDMLKAFAGVDSTAKTVEALGHALARTRYSEDIATDVVVITLLARHVLEAVAKSGSASETLLMLEWLADLSVNSLESNLFTRSDRVEVAEDTLRSYNEWMARSPGFVAREDELVELHELDNEADPSAQISNRLPTSRSDLEQFVREISTDDMTVHSIGLTAAGSLVRVTAANGDLDVFIEPNEVFDKRAHKKWAKRHPYDYVKLDLNDPLALNKVEQSLAGIGIAPGGSGGPILLIPDVSLQNIPPNLLLVDGQIAGMEAPMATAPSLTWLKAAHASAVVLGRNRNAWIPSSDDPGDVLSRLSQDLGQTLTDHNFSPSSDPLIPEDMRDSDLAVIGAHGGLQAENEWFRVVADERSTRLTSREVATKVRGSKVVVLFICSGGRLDPHPYASSTIGLPQLLLDYGCRTVIASPWPIAVSVASVWLPEFLNSFDSGERAIKANSQANRAVAEHFSYQPTLCLAMNLFGDPFTIQAI
jgi:hypothetical protein